MAEDKPKPIEELPREELLSLLTDSLLTIEDLTHRLAASDPADFSDVEAPPTIGETRTARDSPAVKRAMVSLDVAVREVSTIETITALTTYIANRYGATLL